MSKYIVTEKTTYNLDNDRAITLKGDVNNLNWFTKYEYDIYIGSGGTEFHVASGKTASDFSGGISIPIITNGENNFARIATPTGQSCYIKAKGDANGKTVEYQTYISLKAPGLAMPNKFKLKLEAVNIIGEFQNRAVKGFSELKATLTDIQLAYDSYITKISFNSLLFKDVTYGSGDANAKNTVQTVVSDKADISGDFTLICTVINSFGYAATVTASIGISNYDAPTLDFDVEPSRTVDAEGTPLERKNADKNRQYGFGMSLSVKPYSVTDGAGTDLNKIVECGRITLTDVLTGAVADLSLSGTLNTEITENGELTASYLSGSEAETVEAPLFEGADGTIYTGLATFKSYKLKVTVRDTTGNEYTLTKSVPSMVTTFHLKRGGRGAKFGGYAEQDDVLESDWKIQGNDIIEAVADDTITKPGGKGTVKGRFVEASSQFILNGKTAKGIGEGEDHIAPGNHRHGPIKADGTADTANAVIISDSNKKIKAVSTLPTSNLTIEKDTKKMMPCAGFTVSTTEKETYTIPGTSTTVTVGKLIHTPATAGITGEAVRSDHTHPYSREWMNDPIYIQTIQSLSAALSDYL